MKSVYGTPFFFLDPLSWDFGIVSLIEFISFFLSIHVILDLYLSYISTESFSWRILPCPPPVM